MLTDKQKSDLHALNAAAKTHAITQQISRIHVAVNDGTLDRDAANDAMEQLTELTGTNAAKQGDSFGNSPQSVSSPPTAPSPQVTGQPDPHPNPNQTFSPANPPRP